LAELAGSRAGFETARLAAAALAMTASDLLIDEALRQRAVAEFRRADRAAESSRTAES
jgi:hypothetical protein